MSDEDKTSDYYRQAIAELEAVSADFSVDDAARDQANARISELRQKAQDAALDDVTARTQNLQALSQSLSGVLEKAQGGGASGLQALVQRIQKTLGA